MAIFNQPFLSGGFPSMNRAAGAIGGWVELGRTTLGSAGAQIDVTSFADKRYYMILMNQMTASGGTPNWLIRTGSSGTIDTGTNYARRTSQDGATDATSTSVNNLGEWFSGANLSRLGVMYGANLSAKEKLFQGHFANGNTAGASNAPNQRIEFVGKHAQTSNPLDSIRLDGGAQNYGIGSEVVVLGWDPADTHTNNFWEELASVNTTSGDNLSSGTITAKKYLWIQMYMKYTSTGGVLHETFNNDTGNNYASRDSYDGGADGTSTSAAHIDWDRGVQDTYWFINQFIINNASNEKLCIGHQIRIDSTETGSGVAPHRSERVDKWANTSNQITEIDFDNTTAGIDISNGWLKVWGSD